MGTFLTPVGFGPFTLHAAPLHPPAPWTPCRLPAGEGSRAPPGRSLAKAGVDEIATAAPRVMTPAMTPVSVRLNVAFIGFLPKSASPQARPVNSVAVLLERRSMPESDDPFQFRFPGCDGELYKFSCTLLSCWSRPLWARVAAASVTWTGVPAVVKHGEDP